MSIRLAGYRAGRHRENAAQRDERGRGSARIANARIDATRAAGASLTWDASALPRLVQWEIGNVVGHYAVGDRAFNRASRQSGGPNPVSNPGALPVPALGVTIELLKGAAGANLLDPEAS